MAIIELVGTNGKVVTYQSPIQLLGVKMLTGHTDNGTASLLIELEECRRSEKKRIRLRMAISEIDAIHSLMSGEVRSQNEQENQAAKDA